MPILIHQTWSLERRWMASRRTHLPRAQVLGRDDVGGEGGSVVGADHVGQAVLAEGPFKQGDHELMLGGGQADAGEAVPGEAIDEGKGVAPVAVQGLELALEVSGPDRVGAGHGGVAEAGMARVGSPAPGLD
jgi:hypothetical protein